MQRRTRRGPLRAGWLIRALVLALLLGGGPIHAALPAAREPQGAISEGARRQIAALLADKAARTPAQQKLDSNLLYAARQSRGLPAAQGAPALATAVAPDAAGRVEVDITATASKALVAQLEALGAEVSYADAGLRSVRARAPLERLEALATLSEVVFIQPRQGATTTSARGPLPAALAGTNRSEGDATHRAALARSENGVDGAGIKVGVLSDGVNSLAALIASGDLPADVTVLPGQAGNGDEGAAMLEIVHDLAPGAQLYFATAFGGIANFARNIRALRAAGCDIIIDDVFYFAETPFQMGQAPGVASTTNAGAVIQAVLDVTADGALYFASAGNEGNLNDGRSGVWEGDFADGGAVPVLIAGNLHDFDAGPRVAVSNTIAEGSGNPLLLHWADPLGGAQNDYDLFVVNAAGTQVVAASTDIQNGSQDPIEDVGGAANATNNRVVVVKRPGAAERFLHLNSFRGRLEHATAGQTHGHAAVDSAGAFGVAASPVGAPFYSGFPPGPFPEPFNATNVVEGFSADGPRRYFFGADGAPVTAGNFSSTGGALLQKPDLTAADGVSCAAPGFSPFYGTSAAAPHAGAIAALVKSADAGLAAAEVRAILADASLDIEAPGVDRDSGAGILDALRAVEGTGVSPRANLTLAGFAATPVTGDGDSSVEPGEAASLALQLANTSVVGAAAITATIATSTRGVTILSGASAFPDIGGPGEAANSAPFLFALAGDAPCGLRIDFTLSVGYAGGPSPKAFAFSVQTGQAAGEVTAFSFTGPAVAIPNNLAAGVTIPFVVAGPGGAIADLDFRIDGANCSAAAGSATAGIDHTHVGDLVLKLSSPAGTTVTLIARPGGANNDGNNFCQTLLDDEAASSIQSVVAAEAPYVGRFRPSQPLSAFDGEAANGTWRLNVSDNAAVDSGSVRAFSLLVTQYVCDAPGLAASPTSTPTYTSTPTSTSTATATLASAPPSTPTASHTPTATHTPASGTPTRSPTRTTAPAGIRLYLPAVFK